MHLIPGAFAGQKEQEAPTKKGISGIKERPLVKRVITKVWPSKMFLWRRLC